MRQYIALIHKDLGSDYGVSFPDLPGCISAGSTMDEARAMAEEALAFHLEGLAEDGEAVPEPSSLETVMADRENRDGVAILVPVKAATPKVVRINITMPDDVLARIDAYAERQGMNRSGFLAYAAKLQMEEAQRTSRNEHFDMELEAMFKERKVGQSIPLAASEDQRAEHHRKTAERLFPLPSDR